jgi:exonuclease SbcC
MDLNDENLSCLLSKRQNQLENDSESYKNKIKKVEKDLFIKNQLEKKIPELQKKLEEINNIITSDNLKISNEKTKLEYEQKNFNFLKENLKFENIENAKSYKDKILSQVNDLKNNEDAAVKSFIECSQTIAALKTSVETFCEQIENIPQEDLQKLVNEQKSIDNEILDLQNYHDEFIKKYATNRTCVEQILKINPLIQNTGKEYEMISKLDAVVNGKVQFAGNGKISLETYVQMIYLDHIIRRANLRLRKMTNHQYELCRKKTDLGGKSQSGLELNVKDFYTGRERHVQTMSGGEQFQAALSLALGFADEVQSSSGGIKLDSMFIDEGFGTLDSDSLNKAMKTLEDLSSGDKLVGVISHVDSLKERIQNQILVKKDVDGKSEVKLIIGQVMN